MLTLSNCTLEWDKRRGVLYVHNNETGSTVLRVCSLRPKEDDFPLEQIDITCDVGHAILRSSE